MLIILPLPYVNLANLGTPDNLRTPSINSNVTSSNIVKKL